MSDDTEAFTFGPPWAKPGCCGKPRGCTNQTDACQWQATHKREAEQALADAENTEDPPHGSDGSG